MWSGWERPSSPQPQEQFSELSSAQPGVQSLDCVVVVRVVGVQGCDAGDAVAFAVAAPSANIDAGAVHLDVHADVSFRVSNTSARSGSRSAINRANRLV